MPKAGTEVLAALQARAHRACRRCGQVDALLASGAIRRYQACLLYESLFLSLVKQFEQASEEYFVGLVAGTHSCAVGGYRCLAIVPSRQSARRVVHGERKYLDWIPYNKYTPRRAWGFFASGKPFVKAPADIDRNLQQVACLRNAIAHASPHSLAMFRKEVIGNLILLARERTPAGFLMSVHAAHPRQTRFDLFASYLIQSASHFLR